MLCEYLEQNPAILDGKTVLELGAGTGLVGMVAAVLGEMRIKKRHLFHAIFSLKVYCTTNFLRLMSLLIKCITHFRYPARPIDDRGVECLTGNPGLLASKRSISSWKRPWERYFIAPAKYW